MRCTGRGETTLCVQPPPVPWRGAACGASAIAIMGALMARALMARADGSRALGRAKEVQKPGYSRAGAE
eukprot:2246350-Prymnesium_polylepis.1